LCLGGVIMGRREGHSIFYALVQGPARTLLLKNVRR
jgi:hypothetical protein